MEISLEMLVENILDEIVPYGLYALDFNDEYYEKLFENLKESFNEEELKKKRGTIHRYIGSYFAKTAQKVTLKFTEDKMVVHKEFNTINGGEKCDRIEHKIRLILTSVFKDPDQHKPLPYMWVIAKDIRVAIEEELAKISNNNRQNREHLREKIYDVFDLSSKDITLFLNGRIYIRIHINGTTSLTGERRYGGVNINELQDIYEKYFPHGIWNDIEKILPEILEDKLNFSFITNQTFSNDFIPACKSMIDIIIMNAHIEDSPEVIDGLSSYMLRKYFDAIILYIAKSLLNHVIKRDKNAESFVKYYTDDVIIDSKGKKVQKYAIMDDNGQKWNYSSILSILVQYEQGKDRQFKQEYRIEEVEARVAEAKEKVHEQEKNREKIFKEFEALVQKIRENEGESQALNFDSVKTKKEVADAKAMLGRKRALMMDEEKFIKDKKDKVERDYKNKMTEYNNWEKRLSNEMKNLENIIIQNAPVKNMYAIICNALAKTMIKR